MFERGDDVLFVCYDNEAYMNTGVQRSAATPPWARTATTPVTGGSLGNRFGQGKDVPRIAMAHRIPYVATATVADLRDLEAKVTTAMGMHGARYLHVLVPCPLGWGTDSCDTLRIARLATQSGLFPVFEAHAGTVTSVTPIRHPAAPADYLRAQGRYAHLFKPEPHREVLDAIDAIALRNISEYGLLDTPEVASP
jgi:pyruvate ferredoxin oxidoreductase beta subunit